MLQSLQVHICMRFIQRVPRIARLSSLGYANPQAIASPRRRRGARSARTAARAAWPGRPARRAAPRRRRRARASAPSCRGRSPSSASTASRPRARARPPAALAAAGVPACGARLEGGGGRERTAHLVEVLVSEAAVEARLVGVVVVAVVARRRLSQRDVSPAASRRAAVWSSAVRARRIALHSKPARCGRAEAWAPRVGGGGRGADRPGRLGAVGGEAAAADVLVEARRQPRAGALDHRPDGGQGPAVRAWRSGPGGRGLAVGARRSGPARQGLAVRAPRRLRSRARCAAPPRPRPC